MVHSVFYIAFSLTVHQNIHTIFRRILLNGAIIHFFLKSLVFKLTWSLRDILSCAFFLSHDAALFIINILQLYFEFNGGFTYMNLSK